MIAASHDACPLLCLSVTAPYGASHCALLCLTVPHCASLWIIIRCCASPYAAVPHRTLLCLTVRCCASLVHGLAGADPAPANSDGYTALHIAAQMGYVNGVQLLLEAGCSQQLFNISTARLLAICLMAICLLAICLMAMPLVPTDHLDFLRIVYRPSGLYIDHLDCILTIWTVY